MPKSYYGTIDYDKLIKDLKAGRLKTFKSAKTGTRYIDVNVYINDQPNQYKNIGSISVPLKDEFHTDTEDGKKIKSLYIGNLKENEAAVQEATADDFQNDDDDLPF